jgi:hypothetical protein
VAVLSRHPITVHATSLRAMTATAMPATLKPRSIRCGSSISTCPMGIRLALRSRV